MGFGDYWRETSLPRTLVSSLKASRTREHHLCGRWNSLGLDLVRKSSLELS